MPRRYLLSIDGGGIRGIIPAVALAKLETTTGRPTRETFSFVAGTSTGAIIAAAIAAGIPATRIVELYVDRAREVCHGGYPFEHAAADLHRFDVLDQEASRRDRRGTRPGGSRLVS
jgi:predicted acylesterase/phospholipase RssA